MRYISTIMALALALSGCHPLPIPVPPPASPEVVEPIPDPPQPPEVKMAIIQLAPIGITTQTGFSGDLDDINDDPFDPDGTFMLATATITELQVSFPLPGGDIKEGADSQKFSAWVRRDSAGGSNPSIQICMRDVGGPVTACSSFFTITSTTGQLIEWEWNGNVAVDPTGVDVEMVLQQLSGSRMIDVGAVAWTSNTDVIATGMTFEMTQPGADSFRMVSP